MSTGQTSLEYSKGLVVQHNFIEYNTNGRKKLLCFSMFKTIYSRNEFSVYFVIESSSHAAIFHKIVFSYYLQRNKTLQESYKSYTCTCTMSTNFLHPYFHHQFSVFRFHPQIEDFTNNQNQDRGWGRVLRLGEDLTVNFRMLMTKLLFCS